MDLFTYLMAKNDHNTSVKKDLFSYLLGKGQSGTYTDYSGTSLSINNTKKGKMKLSLKGNTSQTGTPTPSSPIPVNVVSGDNTIEVNNKNLTLANYKGYIDRNNTRFRLDNASESFVFYAIKGNTYIFSSSETMNARWIAQTPSLELENLTPLTNISQANEDRTFTSTFTGYCVLYVNSTLNDNIKNSFQVEVGSTSTEYVAPQSQTYPINLPVENLLNVPSTFSVTGMQVIELTIPSGTTITTSLDSVTLGGENNAIIRYVDSEEHDIGGYFYVSSSNLANTRTLSAELKKILVYAGNGYTDSQGKTSVFTNLMLEKGNKKNSYTPYGTTPIKMRGIGTYEDYFVRNSGKNLLNIPDGTYGSGDFTITAKNGVLTPSFSTIPSTKSFVINTNITLEAGTYTFNSSLAQAYPYFNLKSGDTVIAVNTYSSQGKVTFTLDETTTIDNIYIYYGGTSFTYGVMTPQIEVGSEATIVEPYGTGQWCKYNAIGEIVLNGSEVWTKHGSIASWFYYDGIKNGYLDNTSSNIAKSNYYRQQPYSSVTSLVNGEFAYGTSDSGTTKRLVIKNTDYNDASDFMTWLSTHNTELYYILATPYLSLIEDNNLIEQLDNLEKAQSYNGQTNINQVNNDLPFELDVSVKIKV